ncbi:MAG: SPASM domain-containing protein [Candidatus Paceibacterota bacterium]|jgi:radical SAM protein with 4Fe4S-binding SPASM domain
MVCVFYLTSFSTHIKKQSNSSVGVSIKASSEEKFEDVGCNIDWHRYLSGLRKALSIKGSGLAFVCHPNDCDLKQLATTATTLGVASLNISLYTPIFSKGQWSSDYTWEELGEMIKNISNQLFQAEKILQGKIYLRCSYPLCLWNKHFIRDMIDRKQIQTGCHLSKRSGVVFDTDGSLLVCNHLFPYPIGKYGKDFLTPEEFTNFFTRKSVVEIYDKLACYPSEKCQHCSQYDICAGGCSILWTYFNPVDIIK